MRVLLWPAQVENLKPSSTTTRLEVGLLPLTNCVVTRHVPGKLKRGPYVYFNGLLQHEISISRKP